MFYNDLRNNLRPAPPQVDPLVIGSPWLISKDLIKQHARIEISDDDNLLEIYLKSAITWAEGFTHRTIFQRAHKWTIQEFPCWELRLPCGKTQSVESIAYSVLGVTNYLYGPSSGSPAGTDFQEDLRGDSGALLTPPRTGVWPIADYNVPAPVTINFTAGWAADEVPEDILHAIIFAVGDAYETRTSATDYSGVQVGRGGLTLPVREAMLSPYCMTRWY